MVASLAGDGGGSSLESVDWFDTTDAVGLRASTATSLSSLISFSPARRPPEGESCGVAEGACSRGMRSSSSRCAIELALRYASNARCASTGIFQPSVRSAVSGGQVPRADNASKESEVGGGEVMLGVGIKAMDRG